MKFQYTLLCAVLFDGKKQHRTNFKESKVSEGFDGFGKSKGMFGVAIK